MINHHDSSKKYYMKRILLTIFIGFLAYSAQAQEQDLDRAKRYFDRTYYSEALPFYESAIEKDRSLEVVRNLADCYYYTNDFKSAQKYPKKSLNFFLANDKK